jgi:amino acid transporter
VSLILTIQIVTSVAGVTSPLAFFIAFVLVLTLGISLTQLARHLPSAGGYFTYVSRTVHPRAGFLTAWVYFLYDPTSTALNLAFMGFFFESTMRGSYGWRCPWWAFFLVATVVLTLLVYRGIAVSTELMIFLSVAAVLLKNTLSITHLLHSCQHNQHLTSYHPQTT